MTNAYTFDVTNRNPFGTLNLSELIIKNSGNTPTIEISWYVVQINTNQWKLIVHQICDDNGNCTNVQDLTTLNIPWGNEIMTIISGYIGGELPSILSAITTNITSNASAISTNTTNIANITNDMDNLITWDDNYLCVKDGDTLNCNEMKFWDYAKDWGLCYYDDNTDTIECNAPINMEKGNNAEIFWPTASGDTAWFIKLGYEDDNENRLYGVHLNEDKDAYVYVPREKWEWWAWDGIEVTWGALPWKWCSYMCDFYRTSPTAPRNPFDLSIGATRTTEFSWCYLECDQTEPAAPTTYWGSKETTDEQLVFLKDPEKSSVNIWGIPWEGSFPSYKLHISDWIELANFSKEWTTFFGGVPFLIQKYQLIEKEGEIFKEVFKTYTWVSINGPLAVWNQDNYIFINAYYDADQKSDKSYEIMWKNELAIWSEFWSFLYFNAKTWEYLLHFEPLMYSNQYIAGWAWQPTAYYLDPSYGWDFGIAYNTLMVWVNTKNPNATLDVNGSIRIWNNCVPATWCNAYNAWTMMYYESTDGWNLVICALSSNGTYHRNKVELNIYEQNFGGAKGPVGYAISCNLPTPDYPHPHPGIPFIGGTAPVYEWDLLD